MTGLDDDRLVRSLGRFSRGRGIDQVAYLVPDLAAAIQRWNELLGEQGWRIYSYSPDTVPRLGFRGGTGRFAMRIALLDVSPQIELIQPLEGPSIYHEWLERRGFGLHHIGWFVDQVDAAVTELREQGVEPAQWGTGYGLDGDGGFAYYELGGEGGTVLELIEPPLRRRPSEEI